MSTSKCAFGWMARALALGAAVTIVAAQPAHPTTAAPTAAATMAPNASATGAPFVVSKDSKKKIDMVIATLKDILQSVVNEESKEGVIFDKYANWCKTEQKNGATDLSEAKTALANSKVLSQEMTSTIDTLKLTVAHNERETDDTRDAIAQAESLRNEEKEQYAEDMQMNMQSLRQIDTAIKHVGKVQNQGGFLQNGHMEKLQLNQPGESSYVFGVMKGLKDRLEKSRASLQAADKEREQMHVSFMKTKGETLKALTDATSEKKILLTETSAKQAGETRKIGKLTEEVEKLAEYESKTSATCETTAQDWKLRQEDRQQEKAALDKAIRFLSDSKTSLEQLSSVHRSTDPVNDDDALASSISFLQIADASESSDDAFDEATSRAFGRQDMEIQEHMQHDRFDGIQSVVSKLISTHEDSQQEETKKRTYCEKELASKDDEKSDTTDALAAVVADIDKKSSEVETLVDEVKNLYTSIDQTRNGLEEARGIRKQEVSLFEIGSKDRALALKVLKQAKNLLQKLYEENKAVLLQQAPSPPRSGSRKTTAGFGAVNMVQDIADDITKEQKDAVAQEKEAVDTFEALQKDSQQAMDNKQQDITDRVVAKAKLGIQINSLKETQTEKSDDLQSLTDQLTALHKRCDELVEHYGKRKESRAFEVSQLRDVMDVLAGSSLAPRTGSAN